MAVLGGKTFLPMTLGKELLLAWTLGKELLLAWTSVSPFVLGMEWTMNSKGPSSTNILCFDGFDVNFKASLPMSLSGPPERGDA